MKHLKSFQAAVDLVRMNVLVLLKSFPIFLLPSMPYQASSFLILGNKKGRG